MLTIRSQSHDYTVRAAPTLREAIARAGGGGPTFHLVDRVVLDLYRDDLADLDPARLIVVDATEEQKSYERLTPLFEGLLGLGFRRDATLVVVGGGVLQDIGCFLASVLFRGVRWELVPTTLLAQCDSCVGSKSSVNIGRYKNQIGTFWPPHAVHVVAGVLETLPRDEIRSGIGELLKLALIAGEPALGRLRARLAEHVARPHDTAVLEALALDGLAIKQPYVEEDEHDRGVRNLLNYGHTFGHAFESATHYGIPHGIAVALGIVAATSFSEALGLAPAGHAAEVRALLEPWYQPYDRVLAEVAPDDVLGAMGHDKKNTAGKVNLVLTRGPGRMERVPLEPERVEPLLRAFLASLRA